MLRLAQLDAGLKVCKVSALSDSAIVSSPVTKLTFPLRHPTEPTQSESAIEAQSDEATVKSLACA